MTYVSNDPFWWPIIDAFHLISYFVVASSTAVVYDWVLTFGQEIDLIWRQRWSIMTVLYISVRYLGILYSVVNILWNSTSLSTTDAGCTTLFFIQTWMPVVVNAMLGVIMMTRIHAMYQQSKAMLIFLVVVFLASTIATGVMTAIVNSPVSGVELALSGIHICSFVGNLPLILETWIPTIVWEILALFLAVWIVIKHFRELQQSPTGLTIRDCFTILIKGHVLYFVAFAAISSFDLGLLSSKMYSSPVGIGVYQGVGQIAQVMQMFVLGPRLILSVRKYHVKLVASSDEGTGMATIVFQERGHVSTRV